MVWEKGSHSKKKVTRLQYSLYYHDDEPDVSDKEIEMPCDEKNAKWGGRC